MQHVTNGVRVPTWDSPEADALWEKACGQERWRSALEYMSDQVRRLEDHEIWILRNSARRKLVEFTRSRLIAQHSYFGAPREAIDADLRVFDRDWLTLGFARRFAEYKRPNLLLHDPYRLLRILTNPRRPVQLVLAGKAHPEDLTGQAMIRQWHDFIRRPRRAATSPSSGIMT